MKRIFAICPLLLILVLTGCSDNIAVSGKVTFSDDNTPLTVGMVFFETETFQARGVLDSEGRYQLGSRELTDGLPAGQYRVYIGGALVEDPRIRSGEGPPLPLLESQYESGTTSGLTADVDKSNKKFDFSVGRNMQTAQQLKK